jgi:hypothetical protein
VRQKTWRISVRALRQLVDLIEVRDRGERERGAVGHGGSQIIPKDID